jgi:hypothetical protein
VSGAALAERPSTEAVAESAAPSPTGGGAWWYLRWAGLYVALQVLFLLLLRRASPRFFWIDDQQAQYLPVFHWFGRNLTDGRPPLMSPDLGAGGNFVADPQYGAWTRCTGCSAPPSRSSRTSTRRPSR